MHTCPALLPTLQVGTNFAPNPYEAGSEYTLLAESAEIHVPSEDIIEAIKKHIHLFELDPDIMSGFSETAFKPNSAQDIVCLNHSLIRVLRREDDDSNPKVTMLFLLAALIGYEIAHVLEFRCIRSGRLNGENAFSQGTK